MRKYSYINTRLQVHVCLSLSVSHVVDAFSFVKLRVKMEYSTPIDLASFLKIIMSYLLKPYNKGNRNSLGAKKHSFIHSKYIEE